MYSNSRNNDIIYFWLKYYCFLKKLGDFSMNKQLFNIKGNKNTNTKCWCFFIVDIYYIAIEFNNIYEKNYTTCF